MKYFGAFVIFVIYFADFGVCQNPPSITCIYDLWLPPSYGCILSISNEVGFDNFTTIQGEHLPGFGDENVTEIVYSTGNTHNVPQIICQKFNSLARMDLDHLRIVVIDQNSFRWCRNLESLWISSNNIQHVPDNIFSANNQLKVLDLSNNLIQSIPENIFNGLSELSYLTLSWNNLNELPSILFRELTNLWNLRLSGLNITSVNPLWLENLRNLEALDLSFNQISTLPENIFGHLINLEFLILDNNPLDGNLPPRLFQNLTNLYLLNLDGIGLRTVDPKWFENLHELYFLYLNDNFLELIPENSFVNLRSLRVLSLNQNSLTEKSIPSSTFYGLTEITSIDLSYNQIELLDPRWFQNTTDLLSLSLTQNKIMELPIGMFTNISRLSFLSIGNNNLTFMSRKSFGDLSGLVLMYIQGNEIVALDPRFFDDAGSISTFNFLNNICASENFLNFNSNRDENLRKLEACFGNFRFFVDTQTEPGQNYTFFYAASPGFTFQVQTAQNAQIALRNQTNSLIEILIGAQNNTRTMIIVDQEHVVANISTPNILSADHSSRFRVFWIYNVLLVFRGDEQVSLVHHVLNVPVVVENYGLRTPESHGMWSVRPISLT